MSLGASCYIDFGWCAVCGMKAATHSEFRMHGKIAIALCDDCAVPKELETPEEQERRK